MALRWVSAVGGSQYGVSDFQPVRGNKGGTLVCSLFGSACGLGFLYDPEAVCGESVLL
jgi:hypothetical protein